MSPHVALDHSREALPPCREPRPCWPLLAAQRPGLGRGSARQPDTSMAQALTGEAGPGWDPAPTLGPSWDPRGHKASCSSVVGDSGLRGAGRGPNQLQMYFPFPAPHLPLRTLTVNLSCPSRPCWRPRAACLRSQPPSLGTPTSAWFSARRKAGLIQPGSTPLHQTVRRLRRQDVRMSHFSSLMEVKRQPVSQAGPAQFTWDTRSQTQH